MLLLRHALATLLNDGTHGTSFFGLDDSGLLATALNLPSPRDGSLAYRARGATVVLGRVTPNEGGVLHEDVNGLLGNAEGASEANGGQIASVDPAVHRHARHAKHVGDFRDGEEGRARRRAVYHGLSHIL